MSTIWIIRETRSGSTWFTHHVIQSLGYNHCFVDRQFVGPSPNNSILEFDASTVLSELTKFDPTKTVYSTHFFTMLHVMDKFEDPILIRCARRNKAEQFLSHCLASSTNYEFTNIVTDQDHLRFDELTKSELLIPKKEVQEYMRISQRNEKIWDECAANYKNFTVYYEDLFQYGVDIPLLNLYNCRIEGENGFTQKLPDYKTKVFFNYDMILKWISEYK
jgi:hypothetical protein